MTTTVNQLTAGGRYPHENCGEACTVSVLTDAGVPDTVANVEAFDAAHGDSPADGTGGDVIVSRLTVAGIAAHVVTGDVLAVLAAADAGGMDRVFVAIWSDHSGNPQPGSGIGHWVLWCGKDERGDVWMQPVGGYLARYSRDRVAAAQQRYQVVVDHPIGRTVTVVPSPTHPTNLPTDTGSGPMNNHELMAVLTTTAAAASLAKSPPDPTVTPYRADVVQACEQRMARILAKQTDLQAEVNAIWHGETGR